MNVKTIQNITMEHLTDLIDRIHHYFPDQNDPQSRNEWIRNHFALNVNVEELKVSVDLKDKLLELSADKSCTTSLTGKLLD